MSELNEAYQLAGITEGVSAGQGRRSGSFGRLLERASSSLAVSGGVIFLALIVMSIVSIVGRKIFAAPIQGDVELMQMGTAIGAAAFLPYCEIHDHHIKVDAFSGWLPASVRSVLDAVAHLAIMTVAGLLAWRTALQAIDTFSSSEISTLLSFPMWIPVALLVPSFVLLSLGGAYRAAHALNKQKRGIS